jgi:hypothetical protein
VSSMAAKQTAVRRILSPNSHFSDGPKKAAAGLSIPRR